MTDLLLSVDFLLVEENVGFSLADEFLLHALNRGIVEHVVAAVLGELQDAAETLTTVLGHLLDEAEEFEETGGLVVKGCFLL